MNAKLRFGFLMPIIFLSLAVSSAPKQLSQKEVLSLVNQDRRQHGLTDLTVNPTLNVAALAKARDMLSHNYFAHTSPQGATPWSWLSASGYRYTYAGENLAEGYSSATDLEKSWMSSPTHRQNILSPNYSDVGIAVVSFNNTNLVVQYFGSQGRVTLK